MGRRLTDIELPYVQSFRDRHGRMRFYVRRKGQKRTPLPGLPGSRPFMAAYSAALSGSAPVDIPEPKGGPKSLAALIVSYKKSPSFQNLASTSKGTYLRVLRPIEAMHGHRQVADMPDDKAAKIIEEIGENRPALANLTRAVLRKIFAHSIRLRWRTTNPFMGIEAYKIGTHHTWTDEELTTYESCWSIGTRERMAFDLLLYTAQRIGDVSRMRRSDIIKGTIHLKQQKTGAELRIPIHPNLQKSMHAYGIRGQYLVGRIDGKRVDPDHLSQVVIAAAKKAGLSDRCVPHGLRKSALRIVTEKGAGAKMAQALSGHKTLKEINHYTEAADQERLAVMAISFLQR